MGKNTKDYVQAVALEVFLKKMPTSSLTGESAKGYKSAIEQSVEIAELFVLESNRLLVKNREADDE